MLDYEKGNHLLKLFISLARAKSYLFELHMLT